jgi:hypothetical protein
VKYEREKGGKIKKRKKGIRNKGTMREQQSRAEERRAEQRRAKQSRAQHSSESWLTLWSRSGSASYNSRSFLAAFLAHM